MEHMLLQFIEKTRGSHVNQIDQSDHGEIRKKIRKHERQLIFAFVCFKKPSIRKPGSLSENYSFLRIVQMQFKL